MTRGVFIAWVSVLGIALVFTALLASVGTMLRLEDATELSCTDVLRGNTDELTGHVRLTHCVVDATEAELDGEAAIVTLRSPEIIDGPAVAWMRSADRSHVRWAGKHPALDADAWERAVARRSAELRPLATVEGWVVPTRRRQERAPELSFARPMDPLAVGGTAGFALLLVTLLALVGYRRRRLHEQRAWALGRGIAAPSGGDAPSAF